MTKQALVNRMRSLGACREATAWVKKQPGDAQQIWDNCERGDWLLWYSSSLVDLKLLVRAACLVAREALVCVRAGDDLPRIAIETAERWARGEASVDEVHAAAARANYPSDASASYAADAARYAAAAAGAAYTGAAFTASAAAGAADAASRTKSLAAADASRTKSLARSAALVRTLVREVPL